MAAVNIATAGSRDRRKVVEARLAEVGAPAAVRRVPPPEGRLGCDDYPIPRLCDALTDLGPVFAGFGRYLSTRTDLISRRDVGELAAIADRGLPVGAAAVETAIGRQLGTPVDHRFFSFDREPYDVTLWTQSHHAWIAPGVPVVVRIVRPDAVDWLEHDVSLLPLLQP